MNNCGVGVKAFRRSAGSIALILLMLVIGAVQAGSSFTPYHVTWLTGPATDTDGSYTLDMGAASTDSLSTNDTVLSAVLTTRLNGSGTWVTVTSFSNLPIAITAGGIPVNRTGQGNGTHNYKADYVIYGPGTGYHFTTDTQDVVVTLPAPSNGITTPPTEVTSSLAVGTTPMAMDVASNGDAVVNVPLQLIPGVAGFKPDLALVYSSGRKSDRLERSLPEDTVGDGWRLAGLSQIRRCVVDQASANSIGLNSSDSLCLDGMPLVLTGGTHLTATATYRTQIESYRHIEIKADGSDIWFEVTNPDGTVLQYGNDTSNGSRVDKSGDTDYQWSINKATSVDGNEIIYKYYHDVAKGINYPLSIDYTDAKVEFEYEARTGQTAVNIGSAAQTQSVFLHTVRVLMDSKKVREYRLLKQGSGSTLRVNKIQQCGYDTAGTSATCLKPLIVAWTGDLVNTITNGLGAITDFDYTDITSGSAGLFTERPFGNGTAPINTQLLTGSGTLRTVVTKIRRDNGLGVAGEYHDTSYAYQDRGLESTKHWGFLGFFAQRIKDEQSGIVTYAQYRMDFPFFGSVSRVQQYNNTYGSHTETLTSAETAYSSYSKSYTGGSTVYPYAGRNANYIYESNSQLGVGENESVFTFDGSGYISQIVSTGKTGTGSSTSGGTGVWGNVPDHTVTGVQNTTTNTTKFTNRTSGSDWLIGFVNESTTVSSGGSTVGNITQKATFNPHATSLRVASFTRFPSDATLELITSYTYDANGRTTATTVSGANVASRTTQAGQISGFDADRYPLNFTNPKTQTTTIGACDLRFGAYTNVSDINGETRTSAFDPFGRRTSFTNSDGVTVTTTYTADTSVTINGSTSVYKIQTDSSVTPISRTYYDKLGRVMRTESESFSGSYSKTDTWYDTRGRVQKVSLPYFSGTPEYITPTYDLRDRVTKVTRPDGSYTDTTYSYNASSKRVIVTVADRVNDAAGAFDETQTKVSEYNILGQLVKVTDADGATEEATVEYVYDANGNPTTVTVDGSSVTATVSTMEYDAAGNRTKLIGPDVGTIITTYTALGQVKTNKDNKNQTTTHVYDTLGRQTSRVTKNAGGTTLESANWVWDTATNGKGFLTSRTNNDGFTETYSYNSDSKLSSVVTSIKAIGASSSTNFTTSHTYDSSGRPLTTSYPGGYAVTRVYQANRGYLSQLKNGSTTLQTFNTADAFGNVTKETYGNGVITERAYDPETGQLTDIDTKKSSTVIQDLEYAWRSNGTLESRIANPNNGISTTRKETFGYDAHNRLKLAETFINGTNTRDLTYAYNQLGNITSKLSNKVGDDDVSSYTYGAGAAGPHAVTSAVIHYSGGSATNILTYDDNGAITKYDRPGTTADRHLQYNTSNQPTKIVVGASLNDVNASAIDEFRYGPDGQRYARKTTWKDGSTTKSEHVSYIGDVEYITYVNDPGMLATYKTRIGNNIMHVYSIALNPEYGMGPGYPYTETFLTSSTVEYAHRDHLGGIESVTDQYGNRLQQQAYEPFGSRKDSDWTQNIDNTELANLLENTLIFDVAYFPFLQPWDPIPVLAHHPRVARGFTGHEHLDRTGFIHMNGRVYDPVLGRFLSPDPIVAAPTNSQSWNRYSYVMNNPMRFTDPSGFEPQDGVDEEIVTTAHYDADCPYGYVRNVFGWCVYDWGNPFDDPFFDENLGYINEPFFPGVGWSVPRPPTPPVDPNLPDPSLPDPFEDGHDCAQERHCQYCYAPNSEDNTLGLNSSQAGVVLEFFYPKSPYFPIEGEINSRGIKLANSLIVSAAEIQGVVDVVGAFGPGRAVKPGFGTILGRLFRGEFGRLTDNLTFEERLNDLGGAAKNGSASIHRTEFESFCMGV